MYIDIILYIHTIKYACMYTSIRGCTLLSMHVYTHTQIQICIQINTCMNTLLYTKYKHVEYRPTVTYIHVGLSSEIIQLEIIPSQLLYSY